MPPRRKQKRRRNLKKSKRARKQNAYHHSKSDKKYWHFVKNAAVCHSHNRAVCAICCIDFSVFNTIHATPAKPHLELIELCTDAWLNHRPNHILFRQQARGQQLAPKFRSLLSVYIDDGIRLMSLEDSTLLVGFMSWSAPDEMFFMDEEAYCHMMELLHWTTLKHSLNDPIKQVKIAQQNEIKINQQKKVMKPITEANLQTDEEIISHILSNIANVGSIIEQNDSLSAAAFGFHLSEFAIVHREFTMGTTNLPTLCYFNFLTWFAITYTSHELPMQDDVQSWNMQQTDDFLISNNICVPKYTAKLTYLVKRKLLSAFISLQYTLSLHKTRLSKAAMYLAEQISEEHDYIPQTKLKKAKLCSNCQKKCRKRCSGCSIAYYCSKKCQKRHWLKHKQQCLIHRI